MTPLQTSPQPAQPSHSSPASNYNLLQANIVCEVSIVTAGCTCTVHWHCTQYRTVWGAYHLCLNSVRNRGQISHDFQFCDREAALRSHTHRCTLHSGRGLTAGRRAWHEYTNSPTSLNPVITLEGIQTDLKSSYPSLPTIFIFLMLRQVRELRTKD